MTALSFYPRFFFGSTKGGTVGPLVLAKKPTYGKKADEKYAQGGVLHMKRMASGGLGKISQSLLQQKVAEWKPSNQWDFDPNNKCV
jgi:hypothetical protein